MTGSAGTAVDVLVTCDSSNGRRVWEEGGEIFGPVRQKWLDSIFFLVRFSSISFYRFLFPEMFLKYSACHTFTISEGSKRVFQNPH